jgi:hypothetical protein
MTHLVLLQTAFLGLGVWALLTVIFASIIAYAALRSGPTQVWLVWLIAGCVLAAGMWLRCRLTPILASFPARIYWSPFPLVVIAWAGGAWFVQRKRRRTPAPRFVALVWSGLLGCLAAATAMLLFPLMHDLRNLGR